MSWLPKKKVDDNFVQEALTDCQSSGIWVNGGKYVTLLENKFAELANIPSDLDVIYVNSGTSALHLSFRLIQKIFPNFKKIVTSAFTFPSVVQSYVFPHEIIDIKKDFQPKCSKDENDINVITNLFGYVNDLDLYQNKFVIFDNSATPFGRYKNKSIHSYGFCSIVSLHHTKMIGFGEGGFLIISKEFSELARSLLSFGFTKNERIYKEEGSNFKASEISAIYSLQYLKTLPLWKSKVKENFEYLNKKLNGKTLKNFASEYLPGCFVYVNDSKISLKGNSAKKYYTPLNFQPVSANLFDRILCIPIHQEMNQESINKILEVHSIG